MTLKKSSYFVLLATILLSSFGLPNFVNEVYAQLVPVPPLPPPLPNPLNNPPRASNDSAVTDENTPVRINVLKNDSDADGDPLTVISASTPRKGATAINSDNTITYTPNQGFSGTDSFTYRISDGRGGSDAATVTVTVFAAPENTPPNASNDSATTDENTPVRINVLANDSDPDGDTLTIISASSPSHGAAKINSDNTITYTPNQGFSGTDSFTYTISDGNGGSDAATVNVTVLKTVPVNNPPQASDDSATTNQDGQVTIPVLTNDSDPDGDALTVTSTSTPSNGATTINSDNTITYTPNQGFSGTDSFTYTISDGKGGSDTATVTVMVTAAPPPPPETATLTVESANMDGVTFEGMWIQLLQDSQIISAGSTPFSATVDAGAQYEVIANNFEETTFDHWEDGSTNQRRAFSISQDSTFTAFYQVVTAPQNNPPVAADDSASTNQDESVTISVLSNDSDPDGDALSVVSASIPSNGAAVINSDNTITYTPNQGFSGTDSFTYTISDGKGGSDTSTVNVTVIDASQPNNPPTATNDSASTKEDTSVTVNVLANDSDPDGNTISLVSFDTTSLHNGVVTLDDNGTPQDQTDDKLVYTPPENASGIDRFDYVISDGNGGSDSATVTVTVTGVNDPPIAADDFAQTDINTSVTINVLENDIDLEIGDTLSVTSVSTPSSGTATIGTNNTVTYTPNQNFVGADSFTYTVSDDKGGSDTATVTVTVSDPAANKPPVATDDSATTNEDTSVTIDVLANDSDPDGNTISLVSFDTTSLHNGVVTLDDNGTPQDQTDDKLVYTPPENASGGDRFTYTISDGNGGSDSATVTVTVTAVNDPPIAADDSAEVDMNTSVNIMVLANDVDVDNPNDLSVTSTSTPASGTATINADNTITYTPNQNFVGTDSFTYIVSDGRGGSDTATVAVTVSDPTANKPPIAQDDAAQTQLNTPVTIDVLANDSDPNDHTILLVSFDATSEFNGTITRDDNGTPQDQSDDKLVYTPPGSWGIDTFTYTISDGNGGSDTATVSVFIEGPSGS